MAGDSFTGWAILLQTGTGRRSQGTDILKTVCGGKFWHVSWLLLARDSIRAVIPRLARRFRGDHSAALIASVRERATAAAHIGADVVRIYSREGGGRTVNSNQAPPEGSLRGDPGGSLGRDCAGDLHQGPRYFCILCIESPAIESPAQSPAAGRTGDPDQGPSGLCGCTRILLQSQALRDRSPRGRSPYAGLFPPTPS